MKTAREIFLVIVIAFAVLVGVFWVVGNVSADPSKVEVEEKEGPPMLPHCPKTLISDNDRCLRCHVEPSFRLKEEDPNDWRSMPNMTMTIIDKGGHKAGYMLLTAVTHDHTAGLVAENMRYLDIHGIKHFIIEVFSPGGSLFEGTRIVGLMKAWESKGNIVETRVNGLAASAGFYIFVSGTKGHRFVSPNSQLMWHELISFAMFDISGPADKEDEAKVLRHLQTTMHRWISDRSYMTIEDLDELVRKKELWCNGRQAINRYGFADGYIE